MKKSNGTVVILPINKISAEGTMVTRRVGRPRKVVIPRVDQDAYHVALAVTRAAAISSDVVVKAMQAGGPLAVLQAVKVSLAEECAALASLRKQHEFEGKDIAQLATRRLDGLSKLAGVVLDSAKLGGDTIDLASPRMKLLLDFFVSTVQEAAVETLPAQATEALVSSLRSAFNGWEDRLIEI